jgi:hypothetical protein
MSDADYADDKGYSPETEEDHQVEDYFFMYRYGLSHCSVCTTLSDEDATDRLNTDNSTGISSPWAISEDKTFSGGEPHPCPCPDVKGARHVLFVC